MTIRVPFSFVDVFASQPLTGNPLSLVPDADDLDQAQMRAVAREFNQSETTFLLRPSRPGATVRLRSFTPAGAEVGGAGHNALGAWIWLEAAGRLSEAGHGPLTRPAICLRSQNLYCRETTRPGRAGCRICSTTGQCGA